MNERPTQGDLTEVELKEFKFEGISVSSIDLSIMGLYLVGILIAGVILSRKAGKDIDSYFLGGRKIPWWLLGLSGTASYFDVAGVMWTVTLFYIMGQQFMWPQFMWGGVLLIVGFGAFMGKWLQRSRVMTGAEWMVIRFGDGPGGQFARFSYAVMAVVIAVAFIGFAEYGVGEFLITFIGGDMFPDWVAQGARPHVLAIILMTFTAVYTVAAGLFGVVLTDFIQFCLILIGSMVLIIMAVNMSSYGALQEQMPAEWFSFWPQWNWERMSVFEETQGMELFMLASIVWMAKGLFLGIGGPQQLYDMQRFLAAKNPRDASKAGMLWAVAQTPMWMLAASVAVIGIITWGSDISNSKHFYPAVVGTMLPVGIKGLVMAGLLSAFMSTFSSTVNAGAAYLAHDGYQKLLKPQASNRELVFVSRICSLLIIIAGILVGTTADNIMVIFDWIMMVLGAAVMVPNVLRWFWWRFNGYGYAVATLIGVAAALITALFFGGLPPYVTFPILLAISGFSSVIASMVTQPTDIETLKTFYRRTQPAGAWGPVRAAVLNDGVELPKRTFAWDLLALFVGCIGVQALWTMSTYAVTHQWGAFSIAGIVVLISGFVMYFAWYRKLPSKEEGLDETGSVTKPAERQAAPAEPAIDNIEVGIASE